VLFQISFRGALLDPFRGALPDSSRETHTRAAHADYREGERERGKEEEEEEKTKREIVGKSGTDYCL
jgi:hypothetical protein